MNGYTQCEIDTQLASSIWELIDAIDHMNTPPKEIALRLSKKKNGKIVLDFEPYKKELESDKDIEAVIEVEPTEDDGVDELIDQDLRRAMKFMYFYQVVYSRVQPYELGLK